MTVSSASSNDSNDEEPIVVNTRSRIMAMDPTGPIPNKWYLDIRKVRKCLSNSSIRSAKFHSLSEDKFHDTVSSSGREKCSWTFIAESRQVDRFRRVCFYQTFQGRFLSVEDLVDNSQSALNEECSIPIKSVFSSYKSMNYNYVWLGINSSSPQQLKANSWQHFC